MAITFAIRGDSFTARYAGGYNTPGLFATSAPNLPTVDASEASGVIGGSILNLDKTVLQTHQVIYPARNNINTSRQRSVLIRLAFGSVLSNYGIWYIGNIYSSSNPNGIAVGLLGTSLRIIIWNEYTTQTYNANIATWIPIVDMYYDLVITYDGSLTTGNLKAYVDGSLLATANVATAWENPYDATRLTDIRLGCCEFDIASTRIKVNEFVVWDTIIDPTSVTLTSGTGSLNGVLRTAFVNVASFNGLNYSDPGSTNVKYGTSYNYAGTAYTGSLADYHLSAALQQNSSSDITGKIWTELFGSINTSGLGTASYDILNLDGTTTGISESGLTASSGFYTITPTSISSLLGSTMYILKLTVIINSGTYISYKPITFDNTGAKILNGVNFLKIK